MRSDPDEILLAGRLRGKQRNRLRRLLNMMYRPSELAEEIGFNQDQVYMVYIPLGCPHERDEHNHIFINGIDFRDWYLERYKKRKLGKDQTFCVSCKRVVKLVDPVKQQDGYLIYYISNCPDCGKRTAKIVENKKLER